MTNIETLQIPTDSVEVAASRPPEATGAQARKILQALEGNSFLTLATVSPSGRPHVAGVVYQFVDGALWVHLSANSRKARNVAASRHVAATIPFRKLPVGPPYTVQFQATAELVAMDSPEATALLDAGRLDAISGHGALDMPDGTFCKIMPGRWLHSFGVGVKTIDLIRDPIGTGSRRVRFDASQWS